MIAFTEMLVPAAQEAGMAVPPDPDDYDRDQFPHFFVFESVQIGASMPDFQAHWDNAKIIAAIPEDRIRKVTFDQLRRKGLRA